MSFVYRSPAFQSSCTPSNSTSSSTRSTPSTDASSSATSTSPCPDLCHNDNIDYELENELLVAACAAQDDEHYEDQDARQAINFADNQIRWEDNLVYMDLDRIHLDAIAKARKRRRKMEERERREKKKDKKPKREREAPKFFDFMADIHFISPIQQSPSWTYDELNSWSKDTTESVVVDPDMADLATGVLEVPIAESSAVPTIGTPVADEPVEESQMAVSSKVDSPAVPAISDLAAAIVRTILSKPAAKLDGRTNEAPRVVKQEPSIEPIAAPPTPDTRSRCEIKPIPGKGLGVIATSNIAQGQAIIIESPFLTVDHPPQTQQVISRLSQLSQDSQDLFYTFTPTLAPHHPNRLVDIVSTNVIPLGGDLIEELDEDVILLDANGDIEERCRSGLFKTICRVNHSCAPNSQWTWFESGTMVLRALRPIAIQDEITACYLQDTSMGYADRQQLLFDTWRFLCICPTCSLPPLAQSVEDDRRSRFRQIQDAYIDIDNQDTWQSEGLIVCSTKIKKAIKLLEEGNQQGEVANCRWSLFILSARWGDEEKAKREGSAWAKQMSKMGDIVGDEFRAQIRRPRSSLDWGMYDDDRSGDESECDTDDDFGTTHRELSRVQLERAHTAETSRPIKRNPIRTSTTAGIWA